MPGRFDEISQALECDRRRCECQKRSRSHLTHCPAHDDNHPSLSITAQPDGGALVNCKAGCANEEIIAIFVEMKLWNVEQERNEFTSRRNQQRREQRKEKRDEKRQGKPKESAETIDTRRAPDFTWYFEDAAGKKWAKKARWNGADGAKTFRLQAHDQRTWTLGELSIEDLPLYGTERLADHTGPVYLVEGEKCADALRAEGAGVLALCLAGGASQRQFGTALFPLAGRAVYLLADNDPPGDDLMRALADELRLLDCDVTRLHLPVLPGEDIADYLAAGHTLLELMEGNWLDPLIEPITDGLRVHMPADVPGRRHVFTFDGIEQRRRELTCELSVQVMGKGARKHTHRQRINLLSGSAVRELKSTLRGIWNSKDDKEPWDLTVSAACDYVFDFSRNRTPVTDAAEIEHPGPLDWRIQDFLQEGQPHIIFADGETGKSMLAIHIACAVAYGVPCFDEFYCKQGPVLYVDFETEGDGGKSWRRRVSRVLEGLELDLETGRLLYWAPDGVPLAEQAEAMRRYCDRHGIALVIIDSAIPALGGSPIETEPVQQMFRAIARLRTTSLIISHVSQEDAKGGKGNRVSPFGSRFWYNLPRALYRLDVRPETENKDLRALALFPTKANDWKKAGPIYVDQGFDGTQLGPITFRATGASWSVSEERKAKGQTWLARIVESLEQRGGQTIAELADLLEGEDDVIRVSARRGEGRGLLYRQLATDGVGADQWFAGTA